MREHTGVSRTTISNETGAYELPNLPIGPYRLEASLPGFRTFVQTGITLQVNTNPSDHHNGGPRCSGKWSGSTPKEGVTLRSLKVFSIVSAMHVIAALLFVFPLAASSQEVGSQTVGRSTQAGSVPRLLDGKPDLSGLWAYPGTFDLGVEERTGCGRGTGVTGCSYKGPGPLPMTEWGEQWFRAFDGQQVFDVTAHCFPLGYTSQFWGAPMGLIHTPTKLAFLFEHNTEWRLVYTDGRPQPKFDEAEITWNGHSVGHWEGDTLVIDTVGPWWGVPMMVLDTNGHPVSDVLHLVERVRRIDADTLEIETTFDDPKAYTRPWKSTRIMKLMPPGSSEIIGQICLENNYELTQGLINLTMPEELRRFSPWPELIDGAVGPLPRED